MSNQPPQVSEDLEQFWNALRGSKVSVQHTDSGGPEATLDKVIDSFETKFAMESILRSSHLNSKVDIEGLTPILLTFARTLLHSLYQEQRKQDISVLIQLFLEAPQKPVAEVKEFIRALPRPLLDRVLLRLSEAKHHTGLQTLLSLETIFRDKGLQKDFDITAENDSVTITFYPVEQTGPLRFKLRELFAK